MGSFSRKTRQLLISDSVSLGPVNEVSLLWNLGRRWSTRARAARGKHPPSSECHGCGKRFTATRASTRFRTGREEGWQPGALRAARSRGRMLKACENAGQRRPLEAVADRVESTLAGALREESARTRSGRSS